MSASSQGLGGRLVYFDHAATSWPKAAGVAEAVAAALCDPIGNPGRSGHRASIAAARLVLDTRERLAELLGVHDPSRLIFTKNATEALNLAILGSLEPGDHAVTTSMEHNSVMRPLRDLQQRGVDLTVVQCARDGTLAVADLQRVLRPATKLVVTTHASNVTGTLMPVADIAAMCRDAGVAYLVDAAQTAGAVPIDVAELAIDLLAAPGHKGLLGPTGTGLLYVREGIDLNPLLRGGTGSLSDQEVQPDFLPDALESGTLNVAGLAGLGAAAKAVAASGVDSVHEHEQAVLRAFVMGARAIPALRLCGPCRPECQAGTVSFNLNGLMPSTVGRLLDSEFGIMSRAGLHCAPSAHRTIGTFPNGTVRFSWGPRTTLAEIEYALRALRAIAAKADPATVRG